jgi:hypothetical protein
MLKMLEHNKGIQRSRRNRSLRLLNPDGSFYDPAEDDELKIYIPAEIGTPVNLPENFRKMSPENTVFQMLDTQMSPMGICHNDLLEFSPAVARKDGCFVAVRYGKRFFLRIFSANAEISRFSYAIPEHLTYCGDHKHCLITGILKRVIRKFD